MGNKNSRKKISKKYFVHQNDEIEKFSVATLKQHQNNAQEGKQNLFKNQNFNKIKEELKEKRKNGENYKFEDDYFKKSISSIMHNHSSVFANTLEDRLSSDSSDDIINKILWQRITVKILKNSLF
jgi:hypothetical protein